MAKTSQWRNRSTSSSKRSKSLAAKENVPNRLVKLDVPPQQTPALIKIDKEGDLTVLQLHSQELILTGGDGQEKKSKTILTKNKGDIVCTNNKQYITYEMFAESRKKALETIKEQRDILYKINVAENLITFLLKNKSSM